MFRYWWVSQTSRLTSFFIVFMFGLYLLFFFLLFILVFFFKRALTHSLTHTNTPRFRFDKIRWMFTLCFIWNGDDTHAFSTENNIIALWKKRKSSRFYMIVSWWSLRICAAVAVAVVASVSPLSNDCSCIVFLGTKLLVALVFFVFHCSFSCYFVQCINNISHAHRIITQTFRARMRV